MEMFHVNLLRPSGNAAAEQDGTVFSLVERNKEPSAVSTPRSGVSAHPCNGRGGTWVAKEVAGTCVAFLFLSPNGTVGCHTAHDVASPSDIQPG